MLGYRTFSGKDLCRWHQSLVRYQSFRSLSGEGFAALIGGLGLRKTTILRSHRRGSTMPRAGRSSWLEEAITRAASRCSPWSSRSPSAAAMAHGRRQYRASASKPLPQAERAERIGSALARIGLAEHAGRWPRDLSGGQQQRVAIARAAGDTPQAAPARRALPPRSTPSYPGKPARRIASSPVGGREADGADRHP